MVIIQVRRNDGTSERLVFDKPEIAVGRDSAVNDIVVAEASVSKSHALIARTSSGVVLTDLKSTNGTLVNGAPIGTAVTLRQGDEISVGSMKIWIDPETFSAPRRHYDDLALLGAEASPLTHVDTIAATGAPLARGPSPEAILALLERVGEEVNLDALTKTTKPLAAVVRELDAVLASEASKLASTEGMTEPLANEVTLHARRELVEVGPLGPWLADPSISLIQCFRYDQIELTRQGKVALAEAEFSSEAALHRAMVRLAKTGGRAWTKDELVVERRLPDGSQLVAILPPAGECLCLTIRKHDVVHRRMTDLVAGQALSTEMSSFLARCMRARINLLVCGPDERALREVVAALAAAAPAEHRLSVFHGGGDIGVDGRPTYSFGLPAAGEGTAEAGAFETATAVGFENVLVLSSQPSIAANAVVAMTGGGAGFVVGLRGRTLANALGLTIAELVRAKPGLSSQAATLLVTHGFEIGVEVGTLPGGSPCVNRISELEPGGSGAAPPGLRDRFLRTGAGGADFTFAEANVAARVVLE